MLEFLIEHGRDMSQQQGDGDIAKALSALNHVTGEVKSFADRYKSEREAAAAQLQAHKAQITAIEQKMAMHGGRGHFTRAPGYSDTSWGAAFVNNAAYTGLTKGAFKGTTDRVEVKSVGAITSDAASAGSLIAPQIITTPVAMPRRKLTIRDLITATPIETNAIWYPQQSDRELNAGFVAENPSASKPMSGISFVDQICKVQTLAHYAYISQQAFGDAPGLQAFLDVEMRYGLAFVEEVQLLTGDGSDNNLLGIIPQSQKFVAPTGITVSAQTKIDTLMLAMLQVELSMLQADAIVLHPTDWASIMLTKDTMGRYIAGDPLGTALDRLWALPKVSSLAMTQGQFLVGGFRDGAQIFDRQPANVLASTEDRDNFVKNMVTILAEERLAFTVKQPLAFVSGTFPAGE